MPTCKTPWWRRSFFVSKLITRRRWGFKSFGYKHLVETPWFFRRVFVFLSQFALLSFPTCSPFHITDYHSKPHDYLSFHLSLFFHRRPKRCESSLDFEFIRECMKINKIRPNAPINVKPAGEGEETGHGVGGGDRAWGRAFDQSYSPEGEDIWIFLPPTWDQRGDGFDSRLGWKRLRPNMFPHFHASRTRRTVWKDLEIMDANENKPKVSRFYCIDQLNRLRYCGIKVNGSKEKPRRFLQVQLISVWLTCATITI